MRWKGSPCGRRSGKNDIRTTSYNFKLCRLLGIKTLLTVRSSLTRIFLSSLDSWHLTSCHWSESVLYNSEPWYSTHLWRAYSHQAQFCQTAGTLPVNSGRKKRKTRVIPTSTGVAFHWFETHLSIRCLLFNFESYSKILIVIRDG